QRSEASGFARPQQLARRHPPEAPDQPAPDRKGEEGGFRHSRHEGAPAIRTTGGRTRRLELRQALATLAQARSEAFILRCSYALYRPCGEQFIGQHPRDIGAGTDVTFKITLGEELLEGAYDSVAG